VSHNSPVAAVIPKTYRLKAEWIAAEAALFAISKTVAGLAEEHARSAVYPPGSGPDR
jgi:hypothetical protein